MIFITLVKWKQKPTKEMIEQSTKRLEELAEKDIKLDIYWTLGRYDAVTIIKAPSEKDAMQAVLLWQDVIASETMVAIPRVEVVKLL